MKILPKLLLLGILVTISLPSPAQQLIRLQGTDTRNACIHIADIYGNQRLSVNANADSSSVTADIETLSPGIYIATLVADGNIVNSIRIIVSK